MSVMKNWKPDGWWRVIAPDGSLWCESSDQRENRESMRVGDMLQRHEQHVEQRWVTVIRQVGNDEA